MSWLITNLEEDEKSVKRGSAYSLRDDSTPAMTTTRAAITNTTAASAVATTSLGPPWIFHIVTVTAIAASTPETMTAVQTSRTRVTIQSLSACVG